MRFESGSFGGRFGGRILRYILSGMVLLAVDYATFFVFDSGFGAGLALSQGFARSTGAISGFFLQKAFVFRARSKVLSDSFRQGFAYVALTILNIALSAGCADFLGNRLGLRPHLAVKLCTDIILAGETFLLLHVVFRKREGA